MPSHGMRTTLNRFVAAAFAAIAVGGAVHAGAADADAARLPDVATPPGGVLAPDRAPERRVSSPVELEQVLRSDFKGRVVIPRDVRWVMENPCGAKDEFGRCVATPLTELPVKSGVSIVGERGALGSRPMLIDRLKTEQHSLFRVTGNDVRITGLHLRGPKPVSEHATRTPYVNGIFVVEDAQAGTGRRVLIDDNEMEMWAGGAVSTNAPIDPDDPKDWPADVKHLEPSDAGLVRVERNYLHHNAMDGGGYGVVVGSGSYVTITGNVFDTNRHAVASGGEAYSGYVARFNYVLGGGVKQGGYWNQHFDVHGIGPGGYGGYAGEYHEIAFNTIRGEQDYYVFKTRPAFMLRGRTAQGSHFNGNVVEHDDLDEAVSLKMEKNDSGIGEDHRAHNFHAAGNRFDVDYSREIAAGDFDGDGRDDVFVANGTAWFYSRAGVRHWEFLHASNKRTHELGFADIDNDGITDVLYRDGAGRLGYLKSGREALRPLTTVPVAIKDVRFGDFDGDRRTDMFYTRNQQWHVWYGRTRTWTRTNSSVTPIGEMLFGEFDAVRGTDIVAVRNGAWSISSGAVRGWTKLNDKLSKSFANAIAMDVEGDGRDDIVLGTMGPRGLTQKWTYSRNGRGRLETLRDGVSPRPYVGLKQMLVGRFDATPRERLLTFGPAEKLVSWQGAVTNNQFSVRHSQAMR